MHTSKRIIACLLLVLLALQGSWLSVSAEQLNSVKDCLEDKSKCSEEQLQKQAEDDATNTEEETPGSASVGITFWDFLKMILATLFVIFLLYIILRSLSKRSRSYNQNQLLLNLGGTPVGTNRSVQLVRVGQSLLVLGVGENISLLKEITNEDEAKKILADYDKRMDVLVQPSDIITKMMETVKRVNDKEDDQTTFSTVLKSQLEELTKGRKKLLDEMEKKKGSDEHE